MAEAYAALLVADDNKSCKSEAPTAFYHLRDAVDVNELVDKLAVAILAVPFSASFAWFSSHEPTLSVSQVLA